MRTRWPGCTVPQASTSVRRPSRRSRSRSWQLVAWRHTRAGGEAVLLEAIDPICGMTVAVEAAGDAVVFEGVSYYFCSDGCRSRLEAEPARYALASD